MTAAAENPQDAGGRWSAARELARGARLSVIMPFYNLAQETDGNLSAVSRTLDASGIDYELVPVDDGSRDGTRKALAAAAAAAHGRIKPVFLNDNSGKGAALKAGFAASSGGFVLLLDGDLDILPERIPDFFDAMKAKGADIVVGSKRHPASSVQYPWHRRLASFAYYSMLRILGGVKVTDTQTGMKLFRRKVLGEALDRMLVKTYAFDFELLAIAAERGAVIAEAPVTIRYGTKFGALSWRTVRNVFADTLAVFYRRRILDYYAKVEVPPPMEKPLRVSVVIACPHPSVFLDECLSALAKQTYREFETIVLPDGEYAAPEAPYPLRFVATGKIRPAEKRNLGIKLATGDIVAFIDDDAYPEQRWLEHAVKYFTAQDVGAVGGPAVTPPGDPYLAKIGGRVYASRLVSGNYRFRYCTGLVKTDVDDYPSCNLLVRTSLLRQIGGYRTDFWPGEDTLLCDDIVYGRKKRIVYDPWAVVYHHRRPIFGPHLRQLGRYAYHRGYFVKRFPATSRKLSYFVPSAFLVCVAAGGILAAALPFALPEAGVRFALFYSACLAIYGAAVLASAFCLNPATWLLTALGIAATHLWYGARFLAGLCAARMPCEVIEFDHPEAKTPSAAEAETP